MNRIASAAFAAALVITAATPAQAGLGKLGKALKTINKVANGGVVVTGGDHTGSSSSSNPDDYKKPWEVNQSSAPLSQLPPEFSRPFPPTGDPELTAANISRLIERDMGGITKVLKLTAEREPGPMWTDRMSGGELESTWASLLIHAYVQHTDGSCSVYLTGFVVEKPWLPLTERFGAIQADNQDVIRATLNSAAILSEGRGSKPRRNQELSSEGACL